MSSKTAPRLTRVYVNNYRCFVNFELKPGTRSLLLGYNGTGKSSVLDVFQAVRLLVVRNLEVREAFPSWWLTLYGGSPDQRFEFDIEADSAPIRYTLVVTHDVSANQAVIKLEELSLGGRRLYRFENGLGEAAFDDLRIESVPVSPHRSFLASLEAKNPASPLAAFKQFFASGLWFVRLDPKSIKGAAPREDDELMPDGSNFASLCRSLLQQHPDRMQRAYDSLREVMSGFQHLRLQPAGREKVLVTTFRYPGGQDYDLLFDSLSDGQKVLVVLYVVLHCFASERSVLCLDEPDNFVSLREIQPFFNELADISDETGLQTLVISHSPEVIDLYDASEMIVLERPDGGHTRITTMPSASSLKVSEQMARGWLSGGTNGAG